MRNSLIACIVLFTTAGTAFSETKEPPKKLAADLGGGVKMELVLIPSGEFKMGSGESAEATAAVFNETYGEGLLKADYFKDEHPQHRVRITKPFDSRSANRGGLRRTTSGSAAQAFALPGLSNSMTSGLVTVCGLFEPCFDYGTANPGNPVKIGKIGTERSTSKTGFNKSFPFYLRPAAALWQANA